MHWRATALGGLHDSGLTGDERWRNEQDGQQNKALPHGCTPPIWITPIVDANENCLKRWFKNFRYRARLLRSSTSSGWVKASRLSGPSVIDAYRAAYRDCAVERKPGAKAIQRLVTAWKI